MGRRKVCICGRAALLHADESGRMLRLPSKRCRRLLHTIQVIMSTAAQSGLLTSSLGAHSRGLHCDARRRLAPRILHGIPCPSLCRFFFGSMAHQLDPLLQLLRHGKVRSTDGVLGYPSMAAWSGWCQADVRALEAADPSPRLGFSDVSPRSQRPPAQEDVPRPPRVADALLVAVGLGGLLHLQLLDPGHPVVDPCVRYLNLAAARLRLLLDLRTPPPSWSGRAAARNSPRNRTTGPEP